MPLSLQYPTGPTVLSPALTCNVPLPVGKLPHPADSLLSARLLHSAHSSSHQALLPCQAMQRFLQDNDLLVWEPWCAPPSCYYNIYFSQSLPLNSTPEPHPPLSCTAFRVVHPGCEYLRLTNSCPTVQGRVLGHLTLLGVGDPSFISRVDGR